MELWQTLESVPYKTSIRKIQVNILFNGYCYGLNALSPQNSYVEVLYPNVMVLDIGIWGSN